MHMYENLCMSSLRIVHHKKDSTHRQTMHWSQYFASNPNGLAHFHVSDMIESFLNAGICNPQN